MAIKKMTHANGTQTPDEIIVDYAIHDGQGNQIDTTYAKLSDIPENKLFSIHVTLSGLTAGTADKSSSEIYTALQAGKTPVVFVGNNMAAFLTYSNSSKAIFIYHNWNRTDNTTGSNDVARMEINDQKSVTITWTSYAKLASPTFTGTPTAPTAATSTNTTQIATTAFVKNQFDSLALTGTPTAPTATVTDKTTQIATTAFVKRQIGDKITFTEASDGVITCDTTFSSIYNLMTSIAPSNILPIYYLPYSTTGTIELISTTCKLYDMSLAAQMDVYFLTIDSLIIITYDSDNLITKTITQFAAPINSATGVNF